MLARLERQSSRNPGVCITFHYLDTGQAVGVLIRHGKLLKLLYFLK